MSIELRAAIAAVFAGVIVVGAAFIVSAFIVSLHLVHGRPGSASVAANSSPSDPSDIQAEIISGGQHFNRSCAGCHGADGVGGGGAPNLHNEDMSDSEISTIIFNGNGPMPAFAGTYNRHQISSLVAYIRSLK